MHDQTLSLNFGENGLSTWRVIYLANTSSWSEIFASICFPASFGNSPNMLAFLILSDDWEINRLGGGDDLSFVLPEKPLYESLRTGWKAACRDCGRPVGSSPRPLPQGHTQVPKKKLK